MPIKLFNNIHILSKNIKNQIPFSLIFVILQYSKTVKKKWYKHWQLSLQTYTVKITVNKFITELHTITVNKNRSRFHSENELKYSILQLINAHYTVK